MSETRWMHNGVQVDTFAGPESAAMPDRRRIQVATMDGVVIMNMDEWRSLVTFIRRVGNNPYASDRTRPPYS